MAFNNVGDFWLGPGEEIRIGLALGGLIEGEPEWGGHDFGAQWIMADSTGIRPGALLVKDDTKE
ncbi:MAG: hypothetical protein WCA32_15245 [Chromatiaceae bacterium]|jgi:hypothetical protein